MQVLWPVLQPGLADHVAVHPALHALLLPPLRAAGDSPAGADKVSHVPPPPPISPLPPPLLLLPPLLLYFSSHPSTSEVAPPLLFPREILDRQQGEGAGGRQQPGGQGEARRLARWGLHLPPATCHLSSYHPPPATRPRMRGFTLGGFRFRFGIVFHTVHQVR